MAGTILVFAEQRGGELRKAAFEALGAARSLAAASGDAVVAVVAGKGVSGLAGPLAARGATRVLVADADALEHYDTESCAAAVAKAAEAVAPWLIVMTATAMGKDLAPRVAARLGRVYLADATTAAVEGGSITATRPQYGGRALVSLRAPARDVVLAVRPNVFPAAGETGGSAAPEPIDPGTLRTRARVVAVHAKEAEIPDVAEAEIIVAGGRGLKGPEHFPLLFDLARALGAGVGASRAVVDAGWIDHDHQVGQTGKTVSPTLYFAFGISGAIQHLAGMRTSKCIVAVNKDPDAPIFQVADYGLVGDAFEILPRLTEAVRRAKGSA